MADFRFELKGFEKVVEIFDKFAKRYPQKIATEAMVTSNQARRFAVQRSKKDTGVLRASTRPIFRRGGSLKAGTLEIGVGVVASAGGDRVRAAGAYEFGATYRGKPPPIHKLMDWAKRHGARGDGFLMAKTISKNIKKRGIAPTRWMSESVRMAMEDFGDRMADAIQDAF